jgi:hypothetical protein
VFLHPRRAQAFSAENPSSIAGLPAHRADFSNARQVPVDLPDSSQGNSLAVRDPSIRPAADLQDPAALVRPEDGPDSVHVLDSGLRVLAALAHDLAPAVLLRLAKRHVRSAHRRIAHAAAASSIRRPRKAR